MVIKRFFIVLIFLAIFGGIFDAQEDPRIGWGGERVWARGGSDNNPYSGWSCTPNSCPPNGNPTSVPEPTSLILLGIGFAGIGAHKVIRSRKNRNRK